MFAILAATLTIGNIDVQADDIGVAVVSENSSQIKDVTVGPCAFLIKQ